MTRICCEWEITPKPNKAGII
ncbi:hypothetical protein EZS27_019915, partial [termite gut metagenome]